MKYHSPAHVLSGNNFYFEVREMWRNLQRMLITIKLECSQSLGKIEAKLGKLLPGMIILIAENTACYGWRNVKKLEEDTV